MSGFGRFTYTNNTSVDEYTDLKIVDNEIKVNNMKEPFARIQLHTKIMSPKDGSAFVTNAFNLTTAQRNPYKVVRKN